MEKQGSTASPAVRKGRADVFDSILKLLQRNPMTTNQLAKALAFSATTVRGYTKQLADDGDICHRWLAVPQGAERVFYRPMDVDLVQHLDKDHRREVPEAKPHKTISHHPQIERTTCPFCAVRSDIGCGCQLRRASQYITIGAAAARVVAQLAGRQHG